jgi:hypothetical protein
MNENTTSVDHDSHPGADNTIVPVFAAGGDADACGNTARRSNGYRNASRRTD